MRRRLCARRQWLSLVRRSYMRQCMGLIMSESASVGITATDTIAVIIIIGTTGIADNF